MKGLTFSRGKMLRFSAAGRARRGISPHARLDLSFQSAPRPATHLRFGARRGWLLASVIYAAVHIASGNFMLTMAAFTAGLFWGWLYQREQNLVPCIISHCLWTVTIFILLPVM